MIEADHAVGLIMVGRSFHFANSRLAMPKSSSRCDRCTSMSIVPELRFRENRLYGRLSHVAKNVLLR